MLRGLYTAASGMFAQARRLEVLSDNIANVATNGFKPSTITQREVRFDVALRQRGNGPPEAHLGRLGTGVAVNSIERDFRQGSLLPTGRSLDFALEGEGYFTTATGAGVVSYTRDGRFNVGADRSLLTHEGRYVLDTAGRRIVLPPDNTNPDGTPLLPLISVAPDGVISSNGTPVGRLGLVTLTGVPLRIDHNQFLAGTGVIVRPAASTADGPLQLVQGALETSATDLAEEMVGMIAALQDYRMAQRCLSLSEETIAVLSENVMRR